MCSKLLEMIPHQIDGDGVKIGIDGVLAETSEGRQCAPLGIDESNENLLGQVIDDLTGSARIHTRMTQGLSRIGSIGESPNPGLETCDELEPSVVFWSGLDETVH